MFDDEEDEEEDQPQVTVFFDEDDDEEDEAEDTSVSDELAASYAAKGMSDRALVDEQAKVQDEQKRKKREHLVLLKQSVLTAKSVLAKKEQELHALSIAIHHDQHSETRERVAEERKVIAEESREAKEESLQSQMRVIERTAERDDRGEQFAALEKEISVMNASLAETVRAAASLEQELLRS